MSEATLLAYRNECIAAIKAVDLEAVKFVTKMLMEARFKGSNVFVVGNGGSASRAGSANL